jgi:putative NADPH-quinone reductase
MAGPGRITILQGHPDPRGGHFGHALAEAYAAGARAAGREVRTIEVTQLDFPLLRSPDDFYHGAAPEGVLAAQDAMRWADHLLIVYPLWYGHCPAVLHAFLEQTFRPGFAVAGQGGVTRRKRLLAGKTARIVVTMGMPALVYRWYYGAHSLKSLERNILRFSGFGPVRSTLVGLLGAGAAGGALDKDFPTLTGSAGRERWLGKLRALGAEGR